MLCNDIFKFARNIVKTYFEFYQRFDLQKDALELVMLILRKNVQLATQTGANLKGLTLPQIIEEDIRDSIDLLLARVLKVAADTKVQVPLIVAQATPVLKRQPSSPAIGQPSSPPASPTKDANSTSSPSKDPASPAADSPRKKGFHLFGRNKRRSMPVHQHQHDQLMNIINAPPSPSIPVEPAATETESANIMQPSQWVAGIDELYKMVVLACHHQDVLAPLNVGHFTALKLTELFQKEIHAWVHSYSILFSPRALLELSFHIHTLNENLAKLFPR